MQTRALLCPICAIAGQQVSAQYCDENGEPTYLGGGLWCQRGHRDQAEVDQEVLAFVAQLVAKSKGLLMPTLAGCGSGHGACLAEHGPEDILRSVELTVGDAGARINLKVSWSGWDLRYLHDPEEIPRLCPDFRKQGGPVPTEAVQVAQLLHQAGCKFVCACFESDLGPPMLYFRRGNYIEGCPEVFLGLRFELSWRA